MRPIPALRFVSAPAIALALFFVLAAPAFAQSDDLAGPWVGALSIGPSTLDITVTFAEGTPLTATIDLPQQGAIGLPLQNIEVAPPSVAFELQAGPGLARFDGTREGDTIAGAFTQAGAVGTFEITKSDASTPPPPVEDASALPDGVEAEDVTVETPTGTLHGTLTLPNRLQWPAPAVLLIAGSGPTDRDGNSAMLPGKNNSLRMLAETLSAEGVAVLRFDKRGIGASAAAALPEADVRLSTFVDDAVAWGEQMHADLRLARPLTVVGHSEGALVGLLAAEALGAEAAVALAGLGRPMQDVLRRQLAAQLPPATMVQADSILARLERGEATDDIPPMLAPVFRPSVQPYLTSVMAYDPAALVANLDAPVLVVNGTTDVQVDVEDGERLAATENADLVVIDGMNHVLKAVEGTLAEQIPSYGDPALPLHPDLVPALTAFLARVEQQVE